MDSHTFETVDGRTVPHWRTAKARLAAAVMHRKPQAEVAQLKHDLESAKFIGHIEQAVANGLTNEEAAFLANRVLSPTFSDTDAQSRVIR